MRDQAKRTGVRQALRRWDWLLVAAIAPLMMFPEARHAWWLAAFLVVLGVQWWAWGEALPLTPLNPAILLMAVMTGVSIFVTPDPAASLGKIAGVLYGMLVFFSVARHARTRQGWRAALGLWSMVGMGVAVVGLAGTRWFTTKLTGLNALTSRLPVRISGLPGAEGGIHPNELAGSLLWVFPVVVLAGVALVSQPKWFASRSGRGKVRGGNLLGWVVLLGVAIFLSGGVLLLSQSRGSYLAIVSAGLIVVLLMLKGRARWWMAWLLGAALIGIIVLVSQVGMQVVLDELFGSLPMSTTAFSLTSLNSRMEIWSRAIWAIKDVPLTGLGMNVFRSAIYMLYPTYQVPASFSLGHAHNELLQAALDLGLPGLVGILALYAGAMGMLARAIQGSGVWRLLSLGLFGGLLAHFLFGLTDAVALGAKPGFLFWWLMGMVYGLYEQNRAAEAIPG